MPSSINSPNCARRSVRLVSGTFRDLREPEMGHRLR
jgi:hypothetical protein